MEAATLPAEQEQDGAPVEAGAEATRASDHLFKYSDFVHAGAGAGECEHREDGACKDEGHFHAWLRLPNAIQHGDIQEKARAAKARRRLAMRDAGTGERPPSDAYAVLEAELDDLMHGDRDRLIATLAEAELRKGMGELLEANRAEERFSEYRQQREEWERLSVLAEEDRPREEWEQLDRLKTEYEEALEARITEAREVQREALAGTSDEQLRDLARTSRIEGESEDVSRQTYYIWMGFVCARKPNKHHVRAFDSMADFRDAPPEVLAAIDAKLDDLEIRLGRGDASGN